MRFVYQQTQQWLKAGVFEEMIHDLRVLLRLHASEESDFHRRELGELEAFFINAPVRKHYEVSVKE